MFELHHGDCLDVLKTLGDNSVDSIVTDPPYGISFLGSTWDHGVPSPAIWAECLRVLKPGGYLLAFAGTRTQHRMAVNIEDAGFEIRDMIGWVYGSGFPKSHDVSKAIDKDAGADREVLGTEVRYNEPSGIVSAGRDERTLIERKITAPATPDAIKWQGFGTSLKPAIEPITVARKPFNGTVAQNVLEWGTGAINIDGCRVGTDGGTTKANIRKGETNGERAGMSLGKNISFRCDVATLDAGRWPANLIHDGSDAVKELFPETGNDSASRFFYAAPHDDGDDLPINSAPPLHYCPKASKKDRDDGCEDLARNHHPTVKPTSLMRYLCRLVTPPNGIVLDPFCGSGSTGKAAVLEGFRFIGIDLSEEYLDIARRRIAHAMAKIGAVAPPSAELRSAEPIEPIEPVQLEIGVVPPLPKQGRLF